MRRGILALLAAAVMLFSSCSAKTVTDERFYMDTIVTVTIPGGADTNEILNGAYALTDALEHKLSVHRDGDIARFNDSEKGVEIVPETAEVMAAALKIADVTGGAYDPTLYPISSLWSIAHGEPRLPSDADIKAALDSVGRRNVKLDGLSLTKENKSTQLDLGGAAKGYACGKAVEYLQSRGIKYGMVSFGGNVGVFGDKPDGSRWKIGVRDPFDTNDVTGYLYLTGENFVSVSGDYERFFELDGERYHHIFDPATGYPSRSGVHSAVVITGKGMAAECDALSTALFVLGTERAKALYESGVLDFEAIICADGETYITDGLEAVYEPKD